MTNYSLSPTVSSTLIAVGNPYAIEKITETHFLVFWYDAGYNHFAQVFELNTTTGEMTAAGAVFSGLPSVTDSGSARLVSGTTFLWTAGDGGGGDVMFLAVNTGTWGVSEVAPSVGVPYRDISAAILSPTRAVLATRDVAAPFAGKVSLWNIDAALGTFTMQDEATIFAGGAAGASISKIDTSTAVVFFTENATNAEVFVVEWDGFAIVVHAGDAMAAQAYGTNILYDSGFAVAAWQGTSRGYAQVVTFSGTTASFAGSPLEIFGSAVSANGLNKIAGANSYVAFGRNSGSQGFMRVFTGTSSLVLDRAQVAVSGSVLPNSGAQSISGADFLPTVWENGSGDGVIQSWRIAGPTPVATAKQTIIF